MTLQHRHFRVNLHFQFLCFQILRIQVTPLNVDISDNLLEQNNPKFGHLAVYASQLFSVRSQ
jgi:hypothetical protein